MKIMVVSGQKSLRASIAKVLEVLMNNVQVISTNHEDALIEFLDEDLKAVIICEYDEGGSGMEGWNQGRATFKDISGSADESIRIIRLGFSNYPHDDYLQAPFEIPELIKKLG